MGKDKQKGIKPEDDVKTVEVEVAPQDTTIVTGTYKPIPRFRSGCKNC